ncbi:MAG: ATPase [Bacillota bacterium]|jgi:MoxR-like ATPase
MRQGKARYIFPGSNTPQGFHSFYQEVLQGLERIFILKGGPGVGKSTLIRKIGQAILDRGYDVEFWQCSSDCDSLDGVMIPALSLAVVDGTTPQVRATKILYRFT